MVRQLRRRMACDIQRRMAREDLRGVA
jgi:hypothetical protein